MKYSTLKYCLFVGQRWWKKWPGSSRRW